MTWDVPGAIKEGAALGKELLRIFVPSAEEAAARLEVKSKTKKQLAVEAIAAFKINMRKRRESRLLAAERDKAEIDQLFEPESGSKPHS